MCQHTFISTCAGREAARMTIKMKQKHDKRATVLVHSCDAYEDVWYPFFTLMNRYWSDCPFQVVINTESRKYQNGGYEGVNNLDIMTFGLFKPGEKIPYGKRVREHCKRIETEYVITLMDDFFIRSKVDTSTILRIMDWMDRDKKIGCVCLVHHNDRHNIRYRYQEEQLEGFSQRPKYCDFAHDMQASIWRRTAYIDSWRDFESPWQWESVSNIRSFDDGWKYYDKDCFTPFPIDYIDYKNNEWSGIRKGKWVKETVVDLFKIEGIQVDYSIRGFYEFVNGNTSNFSIVDNIINKLNNMRCYGIRRVIPATLFTIKRLIIQRLFLHDYYSNYTSYLRHKYYEK